MTELFLNKEANPYGDFSTLLIVDDDCEVGKLIGQNLVKDNNDLVVLFTSIPSRATNFIAQYFFDILITDINMPEISGDKLIVQAKNQSPSTYCMAMTGFGVDAAYLAGRSHPDSFIDKNGGFQQLFKDVERGLLEATKRRHSITSKWDHATEPHNLNWRNRKKLREALGFSEKNLTKSQGVLIAAALLRNEIKISKESLAFIAKFSSFQRLEPHLAKFFATTEVKPSV